MNAELLIVASDTSSPLSTDSPVPTDGQPEWRRFDRNGNNSAPDGPFPFTVARWTAVYGCSTSGGRHDPNCNGRVGAIVELVEVTGPSHHANECGDRVWGPPMMDCTDNHGDVRVRIPHDHPRKGPPVVVYCSPDAPPDCWHTPTGKVTRLPQPVPCDRPEEPRGNAPGGGPVGWHRLSFWTADEGTSRSILVAMSGVDISEDDPDETPMTADQARAFLTDQEPSDD